MWGYIKTRLIIRKDIVRKNTQTTLQDFTKRGENMIKPRFPSEDFEYDIYNEDYREEMFDDDAISAEEMAFMKGYEEAG